jgi:hypothetical protein
VHQRHVTKLIDKDHMEFQLQMPAPEGGFAPILTIHYERD